MKQYAIITLGCKVNQCESSALRGLLESSGYQSGSSISQTDLIIINTCTVTGKAAMQSRQAIRQAIRKYPNAKIVVTGCYAQTSPKEIKAIDGIDYIVGHADKLSITRFIEHSSSPLRTQPEVIHQPMQTVCSFDPMPSVAPESRTRAYLKIQDGCNAFCSYCIVPHARGRSRSMPIKDALNHLSSLSQANFKEVVLTGIHLGAYGKELMPKSSLYELLYIVSKKQQAGSRIRISSIEPTEIEKALIDLTTDPDSPVCPHFHIPLQSGDDSILKRMGRPYTGRQFFDIISDIRTAMPRGAIGVDVLAGFPGEDSDAFEKTFSLLESLDIDYLHVFPFSPRKGTPAADFKEKVPDRIIKERCRQLRALGEDKKRKFYQSSIHQTVNVLIEKIDTDTGYAKGVSENYLSVLLPSTEAQKNDIVKVCIESITSDLTAIGIIIDSQDSLSGP